MAERAANPNAIDPAELPEMLRQIYEVARQPRERSSLDAMRPLWQAHVARARREVPSATIEDDGENLYLGELSPGCRACKAGTWDCIFVTMGCNLDCGFCLCPLEIPKDYAGSQFGQAPEEIARKHDRTEITGISFSGGEPFLAEDRLYEWVAWFNQRYPDKYTWIYTNGLLAAEVRLRRLASLGVDEIRFNLAATGYDHPTVLDNVAAAVRLIPSVAVEIPAIPEDADRLLATLALWDSLGVRYLNLHELMHEAGSNSAAMPGPKAQIVLADGHCSAIHPLSRALTLAVMRRVQDEGLSLSVNDCSFQNKLRQVRGRRRNLAPLVKSHGEKLVDGVFLERCCAFKGQEIQYFHPDYLPRLRKRWPDRHFVRMARTAPMSVADGGRWVRFELIQ